MNEYEARVKLLQVVEVYRRMYGDDPCKALRQLKGPYQELKGFLHVSLDHLLDRCFEQYEARFRLSLIEGVLCNPRKQMKEQGQPDSRVKEAVSILQL